MWGSATFCRFLGGWRGVGERERFKPYFSRYRKKKACLSLDKKKSNSRNIYWEGLGTRAYEVFIFKVLGVLKVQ